MMPISFSAAQKLFTLSGGDVSYVLYADDAGRLLNLYWGKRIPDNAIHPALNNDWGGSSFEMRMGCLPLEIPVCGTGWYGTPAVGVRNAQGDTVVALQYVSHCIYQGKHPLEGLPCTYVEDAGEATSLEIALRDPLTNLYVTSCYTIYAQSGVLTRSMRVQNRGDQALTLRSALSASVPLYGNDYDLVHLKGAWARERQVVRVPMGEGEYRISSQRGASGHEENPFLAVCEHSTTEHRGSVWAANFVYSGSFLACAAVDNMENSRFGIGLNPEVFSWLLQPDESFQTPEAVLVYSDQGLNGMSHLYHQLYRTRLIRGCWRDRERPILVNNWEATYFDFTQEKLLGIAEIAKKIGIELFVLDDGWFGKRDSDESSLGDWVVNKRKLPDGMSGLSEKIHAMGLKFGLWFEPEMISPDSDLYRAHPDWCLHVPGRPRSEARHQCVLDLSRPEVQDFVVQAVHSVLSSAEIDYVKWDMNRNMTEAFSSAREPDRQLETQHRYMLGLYRVLDAIVTAYPNTLFESCSGGGGRFDPGMLAYMPQTWTSDNTDAIARLSIQYGTSMAYPASAMGAHVSAVPNHQCERTTSLQMRGDVALSGNFGFELDLTQTSDKDMQAMQELIQKARRFSALTQNGVFSRLISPSDGRYAAWQFVAENRDEALLCVYRILSVANTPPICIKMVDLDPAATYIQEDGTCHSGATLMNMGMWVSLKGDFSSRIIYLKKAKRTAHSL